MNAPHLPRRAVLALAAAGPLAAVGTTPGEVGVGEMLREATMAGLNGPARRLSEFRGRPLLINVWASWCGPCRTETASLERLAWSEAGQHFAVIGISTDDDAGAAQAWLRRSNATFNHYIDRHLEMEHMLGARQLPLTVLVDAEGRVRAKFTGARQWDSPQALQLIGQTLRLQPGGAAR